MPYLIIGHTSSNRTKIWACGDEGHESVTVFLTRADDATSPKIPPIRMALDAAQANTAVATFDGLEADTAYRVTASFGYELFWGLRWQEWETIQGCVRTFPRSRTEFSFLFGSCNLATASMTNVAAVATGFFGAHIGRRALERPSERWFHPRYAWLARRVVSCAWALAAGATFKLTGFEQPEPAAPSPFTAFEGPGTEAGHPRFMIHAGDQIYFDFPLPNRKPSLEQYRRAYRNSWFDDPEIARVFRSGPHYMVPDDHEFVDGFAVDHVPSPDHSAIDYLKHGRRAYREFAHSRHNEDHGPSEALDHTFECGGVYFFLLDTRSKRCVATGEMIDAAQLSRLERWLLAHRDDVKFVVSSVPIVAQVKASGDERRTGGGVFDKWAGGPFETQRRKLLSFLHAQKIEQLVFLVGDMHCTYQAHMRIGTPSRRTTLQELAGGPIQQLDFSRVTDFESQVRGTLDDSPNGVPYESGFTRFNSAAAGVLRITVKPPSTNGALPTVEWNLEPTRAKAVASASSPPRGSIAGTTPDPAVFRQAGRISFSRTTIRSPSS